MQRASIDTRDLPAALFFQATAIVAAVCVGVATESRWWGGAVLSVLNAFYWGALAAIKGMK
jgi:hypothetical protein